VSFAAITFCVASQRVFIVVCLFRYRLSPETFRYTLVVYVVLWQDSKVSENNAASILSYPTTSLHGVKAHHITTSVYIPV
jgi:hypothetical protein